MKIYILNLFDFYLLSYVRCLSITVLSYTLILPMLQLQVV